MLLYYVESNLESLYYVHPLVFFKWILIASNERARDQRH